MRNVTLFLVKPCHTYHVSGQLLKKTRYLGTMLLCTDLATSGCSVGISLERTYGGLLTIKSSWFWLKRLLHCSAEQWNTESRLLTPFLHAGITLIINYSAGRWPGHRNKQGQQTIMGQTQSNLQDVGTSIILSVKLLITFQDQLIRMALCSCNY